MKPINDYKYNHIFIFSDDFTNIKLSTFKDLVLYKSELNIIHPTSGVPDSWCIYVW